MQTFFDRIDRVCGNLYKTQSDKAKVLGMGQSGISIHINNHTDPDFIPKLQRFVIDSKISCEELYYLITGTTIEQKTEDLQKLKSELETYKNIAENLSRVLLNITESNDDQ